MIYIKRKINIFLSITLFISLFFTTIVYSAFSTQLQIRGEAVAKAEQIIRITKLELKDATNGAYATFNSKYDKDTTSLFVSLPAPSETEISKMVYEVTVTNYNSEFIYRLEEIKALNNNNPNVTIDYSINIGDCVNSNEAKTFTITLTNNTTSEQSLTLINQYLFELDNWNKLETKFLSSYDTGDFNIDSDGIIFEYSVKNTNSFAVDYVLTSDNSNFIIKDETTNDNKFQVGPNSSIVHKVRVTQRENGVFESLTVNLNLKVKSTHPVVSSTDVKTVILTLPKDFSTVILDSFKIEDSPESFSDIEATNGLLLKINEMTSSSYTYYFRGVVNNNYFLFADKLWRIVRIDSNGNVRLVLDNNVTPETQFTTDYISGSVANLEAALPLLDYKQSNVKKVVEEWYKQNVETYKEKKYVVESKFCVDLSYQDPFETQFSKLVYYFTPYLHVGVDSQNFTPDFTCSKENVLNSFVGLLSAEEVLAAGGYWERINTNYYLYDQSNPNVQTSWTISASYYSINERQAGVIVFNHELDGFFDWVNGGNPGQSYGYRPVITVSGKVNASGDGTKDNPFKIDEKTN